MGLAISGQRLTLRVPEPADAVAIARGLADYDVARMTMSSPHPYTVEVAQGWLLLIEAQRRRGTNHAFVIDVAGVGAAGCMGVFKRGGEPDWEVGYWVAKPLWGRGYASAALAALLQWARGELGAERVVARHLDDNPASRRVLEKAGFAPTGRTSNDFCLALGRRAPGTEMALTFTPWEHAA